MATHDFGLLLEFRIRAENATVDAARCPGHSDGLNEFKSQKLAKTQQKRLA